MRLAIGDIPPVDGLDGGVAEKRGIKFDDIARLTLFGFRCNLPLRLGAFSC